MDANEARIIQDPAQTLLSRFKVPVSIAIALYLMSATVLYIFDPILGDDKTSITLNSKNFQFKVSSQVTTIKLFLGIPTFGASYTIKAIQRGESLNNISNFRNISQNSSKTPQNDILIIPTELQLPTNTKFDHYQITMIFRDQWPKPSISKITINEEIIDNLTFFTNHITSDTATYVDRKYIRQDLGQLIYKYNDTVSNYILTFLTASIIPLFFYLLLLCWRRYLLPEKYFNKYIYNGINEENLTENESLLIDLKHSFGIAYIKRASWFRFLQVLGPSAGFTLTVSSLIVALYPASLQSADMSDFFHAIQIAMISTLIGLIIRILAITMQRVNAGILGRADEQFDNLETVQKPNESST